jgi:hypothetical protein
MVAEPPATPVTTPDALTVATAKSEELQVPPAMLAVRGVVALTQTPVEPEIVGLALTVTLLVPEQPPAV